MKRKMILALLAAMTLTVGSVGTVFAATNNGGAEVQTSDTAEHTHTWGEAYYVKDADAVYGQVWHDPVYGEPQYVIDKEEEYKDIVERHQFCSVCHADLTELGAAMGMSPDDYFYDVHQLETMHGGYYGDDVVVGQELVSPEEGHWENTILQEGYYEDVLVTPEQGHWEHTCEGCGEIQNSETGEVIKPGTITTPENPGTETPENPDTEKPENPGTETPENPDTNTPTNPDTENPDTEAPVNPGTDTEKPSGDNTQNPTEDTEKPADEAQDQMDQHKTENTQNTPEETTATDNKNTDTQNAVTGEEVTPVNTQTETTESNESGEKKSPKTGDPANFIYLATLAGSALTGGTAFGLKKKFKK